MAECYHEQVQDVGRYPKGPTFDAHDPPEPTRRPLYERPRHDRDTFETERNQGHLQAFEPNGMPGCWIPAARR